MKLLRPIQISILLFLVVGIFSCGPLLERPPDNTPSTDFELYGEENTITLFIDNQPIVYETNTKISHLSYDETTEIPAHSVLEFGGKAGVNGITILLYQDGDFVMPGGYDGASSIFSLDGSVILDVTLDGVRYYSLEYGPGAGGTTIYYNSFASLLDLKLQSYNQPQGVKKVQRIKGTFRGSLRPFSDHITGKEIFISGKVNFKASE